jgi:PhnB protein
MLFGADMTEELGYKMTMGDNISLSVSVDNEEKAKQIFNGLSEGGTITMPLEKTFWAPLFGMLTDKFGINWLVSFEQK